MYSRVVVVDLEDVVVVEEVKREWYIWVVSCTDSSRPSSLYSVLYSSLSSKYRLGAFASVWRKVCCSMTMSTDGSCVCENAMVVSVVGGFFFWLVAMAILLKGKKTKKPTHYIRLRCTATLCSALLAGSLLADIVALAVFVCTGGRTRSRVQVSKNDHGRPHLTPNLSSERTQTWLKCIHPCRLAPL